MHPQIIGPRPARLDASNALFCHCGEVLSYTVNKVCYGIKGIQAVIEEESTCTGKQTVRLVNVRKKAGALFAK